MHSSTCNVQKHEVNLYAHVTKYAMGQSPTCLNPSLNKAEFEKIAEDVKKMKTRPSDLQLLDLYGFYKQAVVGDINIGMPSYAGRGWHINWM